MMTDVKQNLGGRLPLLDPAAMTSAQRQLFDELNKTWVVTAKQLGVQATTADGRLIGPFNALLLHPEISEKLSDFQVAEAKYTTLSKRVREVVIIAVGVVWRAEYELYAQTATARSLGFSDATITALKNGDVPEEGLSADEKTATRFAHELLNRHRVGDALYRQAEQAFGTKGLFDLIALIGEYQTVCGALALFEVPVPAAEKGVKPN